MVNVCGQCKGNGKQRRNYSNNADRICIFWRPNFLAYILHTFSQAALNKQFILHRTQWKVVSDQGLNCLLHIHLTFYYIVRHTKSFNDFFTGVHRRKLIVNSSHSFNRTGPAAFKRCLNLSLSSNLWKFGHISSMFLNKSFLRLSYLGQCKRTCFTSSTTKPSLLLVVMRHSLFATVTVAD